MRSAADLGVWMVDVHASGGLKMMEEAKKILEPYGKDAPLLIAVTVLTSMEDLDLLQIGINSSPLEHVLRLAHLTQRAGLDGLNSLKLTTKATKLLVKSNQSLILVSSSVLKVVSTV